MGTVLFLYNKTRYYPGLLRQSLKFRKIASSHWERCFFSSPRISHYVWAHNSITKARIKKVKDHLDLLHGLFKPTVCHIHVCEAFPLRNSVPNEGVLLSSSYFIFSLERYRVDLTGRLRRRCLNVIRYHKKELQPN